MTALVLEDSQTQANIITRMLGAVGWSALHCHSAAEAFEILKTVSVEALFIDVFCGVQNTLGLLPQFRRMAPKAVVAVMTAGSSLESIDVTLDNARKARADYVLRKPFGEAKVREILQQAKGDDTLSGRRKHILIVDDSMTVRSLTKAIFEGAGYRTSLASSMEEAFKNPDIAHIDLALCDVFMPGMGGLKGMRYIKKVWPHVKIIGMSAGAGAYVSDAEALNAARELGSDGQIYKPFAAEALLELTGLVLNPEVIAEYLD
ncbi:response regulator [Asticcacaulis biprosthecium]|nr:response regulator [Asticcacaulis biprosthecium]